MTGLGRNVRFMIGRFHKSLIQTVVIFLVSYVLLNVGSEDFVTKMSEAGPLYYFILMIVLFLCAVSFGEAYFPTIVSSGSSRKPASIGMLLSQHIFVLEQLVVLFVLAALIENSKSMQIVRNCPLGIVALLVLILGVGNIINAFSIKGYTLFAIIAAFVLSVASCVFLIVITIKSEFGINIEVFRTYNNWWLLLLGLIVDLVGVYYYYKVVTKVDLKLA